MASNDTTSPHSTIGMEVPLKTTAVPVEYNYKGSRGLKKHALLDLVLRVLLFATALAGIIVMVTSEETKQIPVAPGITVTRVAKFNHSPAYVYFVAALSVACLYTIISGVVSVLALMKQGESSTKLQLYLAMMDALFLGIVASATGTAGGVAYIGLKGNSHSRYNKICNTFGSFCFHFGAAILLSLISSIVLLLIVWLSIYVLSKKIARR